MKSKGNNMKSGRNDPCPCGSGKKYKKCCGISAAPSEITSPAVSIDNLIQQGSEFFRCNNLEQAKIVFNKILTIKPRHSDALNYLGSVEASLGNIDKAVTLFRKAINLKPLDHTYYNNLGNALELNRQYVEAIKVLEKSLELKSDYSNAYLNLGNAYKGVGKIDQAYKNYEKSLRHKPDLFLACSNILYLSNCIPNYSCEDVYALHTKTVSVFAENNAVFITQHKNTKDLKRRLRIGYLSPDFREHSCSYFIESVLENHAHENFEIYGYYNYKIQDEITERIKNYFDVWRVVANFSEKDIANLVKRDEIDILIDLSGYTANSPILVFTYKPAPVQITWIGYPNTTGIPGMDYRITDQYSDPVGVSDQYYSERLLRMPECFLSYKPPIEAPDISEPPIMNNGFITFGSFNNHVKINEKVVSLWSRVLKAVPDSRLLLKCPGFDEKEVCRKHIEQFASLGISKERLIFLGKEKTTKAHLSIYNKIDIGLDTFPYNGTTTTCEALWMGVPVVSLKGDCHRMRVGASILCNVGLGEWVANTEDEYIQIAKNKATEIEPLNNLRGTMRLRMQESPLMKSDIFTRHFEQQLRDAWANWCHGEV